MEMSTENEYDLPSSLMQRLMLHNWQVVKFATCCCSSKEKRTESSKYIELTLNFYLWQSCSQPNFGHRFGCWWFWTYQADVVTLRLQERSAQVGIGQEASSTYTLVKCRWQDIIFWAIFSVGHIHLQINMLWVSKTGTLFTFEARFQFLDGGLKTTHLERHDYSE